MLLNDLVFKVISLFLGLAFTVSEIVTFQICDLQKVDKITEYNFAMKPFYVKCQNLQKSHAFLL